ncbi:hypothetical protein L249_5604 [Ophiocordyceps polyrhachis-furcata BCC 54312]|uniref:Uncharacterized protein n=1 Tax=Ophiocordyceps polyrhachis-furcata BCC 54312 TaxID=1330021 RepID=A0A367LGM9_9HYPO|nr:hypothetical protein L249_5604 [Ophiocordyceps polyrhachis-furcata BCC 54312]
MYKIAISSAMIALAAFSLGTAAFEKCEKGRTYCDTTLEGTLQYPRQMIMAARSRFGPGHSKFDDFEFKCIDNKEKMDASLHRLNTHLYAYEV